MMKIIYQSKLIIQQNLFTLDKGGINMPFNNKNNKESKSNANKELRHSYGKAACERRPSHQPPKKDGDGQKKGGATSNR